jgi:2,3-bisphosphoglycerate-independent phosphoglycerate mutase
VALLEFARRLGLSGVAVHHLLDGRDTPPKSALEFAQALGPVIDEKGVGRVATVAGRYFTMDRDQRWERTLKGYDALVDAKGHRAKDAVGAIRAAYGRGESDEFVEPTIVGGPLPVEDGDVVVLYNFRPDRMRQLVRMLKDDALDVERQRVDATVVTLTMYDKRFEDMGVRVAFPPTHPERTWGAYYAELGLRQLRVAETEKYAHVTYFFNGGVEKANAGEDRHLVPSPKVATYDLQPEMSAPGIRDAVLERLDDGYDLIVVNFANADMVGHTGDQNATVEACRVVDGCVGGLADAALERGFVVAVTADHGNAERMVDDEGRPQTAHTTSAVPFIVATPGGRVRMAAKGRLADDAPDEMTGQSLLRNDKAPRPRGPPTHGKRAFL